MKLPFQTGDRDLALGENCLSVLFQIKQFNSFFIYFIFFILVEGIPGSTHAFSDKHFFFSTK